MECTFDRVAKAAEMPVPKVPQNVAVPWEGRARTRQGLATLVPLFSGAKVPKGALNSSVL